jgi:transcriptional regulator with XRE-family HTH domain
VFLRSYLKEIREKKNYSQVYVARVIGISQNYYSNIENGKRQEILKMDMLVKLANVFDLSIQEIVELENKEA